MNFWHKKWNNRNTRYTDKEGKSIGLKDVKPDSNKRIMDGQS